MDDNRYYIDLERYFFGEGDNYDESPTLVQIKSMIHAKPITFCFPLSIENADVPSDILYDANNEFKDLFRERLRCLFRAVSENSNITELRMNNHYFRIPGDLLTEWININIYVTKLIVIFDEDRFDNMQLLCDALLQDTTIKTIGFDNLNQQEEDCKLLGNALRENNGIENIEYYVNNASLTVLTHALGPGSKIHRLTIKPCDALFSESAIDVANELEIILSENTSLTSLEIEYTFGFTGNILPILRGVVNSNTITEFYFSSFDGIHETIEYQMEQIDMIAQMKHLKSFSLYLQNYKKVSASHISSALKGMHSLESLTIDAFHCNESQLKIILQQISKWEHQCKLKLARCILHVDIVPWLKIVDLESLQCKVDDKGFDRITEEIVSWNFIKELDIHLETFGTYEDNEDREYKFATTIFKSSYSLHKISISHTDTTIFFSNETQEKVIDKVLERNEHLRECKNNPQIVPTTEWPKLFAMANPIGLDFSYTCIRKMPNFFLTLLQRKEGFEQENTGSEKCIDGK